MLFQVYIVILIYINPYGHFVYKKDHQNKSGILKKKKDIKHEKKYKVKQVPVGFL